MSKMARKAGDQRPEHTKHCQQRTEYAQLQNRLYTLSGKKDERRTALKARHMTRLIADARLSEMLLKNKKKSTVVPPHNCQNQCQLFEKAQQKSAVIEHISCFHSPTFVMSEPESVQPERRR
ncbi:hypothetical protein KIN20_027797 [Parelaphostrongylus tenuis]|uniref:Uncharacterized protein n=1 Tax=Parelaphostrongylus tenuis TaxID=148309 RepID=A0AAD5QZU2_PARTN|nr:hypothetical protein KIN20_027797 [Parelaphostrongylus tenuis]